MDFIQAPLLATHVADAVSPGPSVPPSLGLVATHVSARSSSTFERLTTSLALLSGAAMATTVAKGMQKAGRRRRPVLGKRVPIVARRAMFGPSEEEEAEEALRALEEEMSALEDALDIEIGEEMDKEAEVRGAALGAKVDGILKKTPTFKGTGVTPSSGERAAETVKRVVVCGLGSNPGASGSTASFLLERLRQVGDAEPLWCDLAAASKTNFEDLDQLLQGCEGLVICPDVNEESPGEELEAARQGLKAVLMSGSNDLRKAIVVSRLGAQAGKGGFNVASFFSQDNTKGWSDLEDELTSNARLRTGNNPLSVVVIRTGKLVDDAPSTKVVSKAVKEDESSEGSTSRATTAEAIMQSLALKVDSSFALTEEPTSSSASTDWSETLLPFIGPEVWRKEVRDARRAAIFVQGWAEEFFGLGKSALRFGVKTPVQLQSTTSGIIVKFRPVSTLDDETFDDLEEGGVEFTAEAPSSGAPRIRAVRCAYGWKVSVKENSEKALLDKFAKDWAEVEEKEGP